MLVRFLYLLFVLSFLLKLHCVTQRFYKLNILFLGIWWGLGEAIYFYYEPH